MKAVRKCAAFATEIETDFSVFGAESALMHFFTTDQTGALQLKGAGARLCGTYDVQETGMFLTLMGIENVFVRERMPQGYHVQDTLCCMVYNRQKDNIDFVSEIPITVEKEPKAAQIADFFCDRKKEEDAWDNFYSELCTKRVRGAAEVWAASAQGKIVSTAGAYAISRTHAFISGVETKEGFRKRKIGAALTQALVRKLAAEGREVSLFCKQERRAFYERLGFVPSETVLYGVRDTAGTMPESNIG